MNLGYPTIVLPELFLFIVLLAVEHYLQFLILDWLEILIVLSKWNACQVWFWDVRHLSFESYAPSLYEKWCFYFVVDCLEIWKLAVDINSSILQEKPKIKEISLFFFFVFFFYILDLNPCAINGGHVVYIMGHFFYLTVTIATRLVYLWCQLYFCLFIWHCLIHTQLAIIYDN